MCRTCWESDGSPAIDNERVREAARLIVEVYEFSSVGGNLHVAVDDFNLDDDTLEFCETCIAESRVNRDKESCSSTEMQYLGDGLDQLDAEQECVEKLKALTFEERVSALGLHDGYWVPPSGGGAS